MDELGVTIKDMGWAGAGRGKKGGVHEEGRGKGDREEGKGRERRGKGGAEGRRVLKGKERRREERELSTPTVGVEHPTNREQDCIP